MEQLKITKKDLTKWLKARAPDRAVGLCGDSEGCVLALYLNDRSGRKQWSVSSDSARNLRTKVEYTLPAWCPTLVAYYDMLGDADTKPTPKAILPLVKRA